MGNTHITVGGYLQNVNFDRLLTFYQQAIEKLEAWMKNQTWVLLNKLNQ